MAVKKQIVNRKTGVISDEEVAGIMQPTPDPQPELEVVAKAAVKATKVGDVIKTYVQNGIGYKRVVTETGTVDMKI